MYERNAIVLERYFDKLFGYDDENNLKTNYKNYIDLVNSLEKYLEASEAEDKIMREYEETANSIKNIQKEQSILYEKNIKLQNERNELFYEIGENSDEIYKRLEKTEKEIEETETKIREYAIKFIEQLREFNEKIEIRTNSEKDNRIIETTYKKNLDKAIDSFSKLNMEKIRSSKTFFEQNSTDTVEEIKAKILKNGEKEKVKFNLDVINKAIEVTTDINKREVECLNVIFDQIGKLFAEIKDDNIKINKHNKAIEDVKVKLEFLNAEKEYIVMFLDNERLNIMAGEKEHRKLMEEACKYLEQDLVQIQNLYELLQKEITGKATKKIFKELYNMEYLYELDNKQREFELKVSKFNLVGTIINPDYWRIEGIRKIYDVFKNIMVNVFEKDLSEYEYEYRIETEAQEVKVEPEIVVETEKEIKRRGRPKKNVDAIEENKEEKVVKQELSDEEAKKQEEEIRRRKLDKILAFINNDTDSIEYDDDDFELEEKEIIEDPKNSKKEEIIEEEDLPNEEDFIDEDEEDFDDIEDDFFGEEDEDFDFEDEEDIEDDSDERDELDDFIFADSDDEEEDVSVELDDNDDNDFLEEEEKKQEYDEDDFEDDTDFDFEADDDDFMEDNYVEEQKDVKEEKKKSKGKKKESKKEKEDKKKKNKETGKNIVDKIKKMSQSNNEIKNMWTE